MRFVERGIYTCNIFKILGQRFLSFAHSFLGECKSLLLFLPISETSVETHDMENGEG